MRITAIPDTEVWPGAVKVTMNPPVDDSTGEIAPCEMVADISRGRLTYSARFELEEGDLAALAEGRAVWLTLWGGVPPFAVNIAPPSERAHTADHG